MANLKAALKSIRQSRKRRLNNLQVISELKTLIKKYRGFLSVGKKQEASSFLPLVVKKLDMATTKGVIHANAASRKKSRLARQLAVLK